MNIGIGVDVGGTHITSACIDFERKQILEDTICTTDIDNQSNALDLLNKFIENIQLSAISFQHSISCIGLAFPGPFDYNKGISKIQGVMKYDNIFGLSLKPSVSSVFPDFNVNKISFLNDADCFLCGEYWLKDLSEFKTIVGITLGTGFGSSYIKKETPDAIFTKSLHTGFFYKTPYKESIADDYISTRWLLKRWKELLETQGIVSLQQPIVSVRDIADLAETDETAKALFNEFGNNLTDVLLPKLEKLNAEMLVIGGNIAKANKYFLHVLKDKIKEKGLKTQILISAETDKSALCGAAYWALQNSEQSAVSSEQTELKILAERIAKEKSVIIDGYLGLNWEDFCEKIERELKKLNLKTCWWSIEAGLEENENIETKIELHSEENNLAAIFNSEYLNKIKPDKNADINIIYGCGASLAGWDGFRVYIDTSENIYPVLNNHKTKLLTKIDLKVNLTNYLTND